MIKREIPYSKLDEIHRLMRNGIYDFKKFLVPDKDIKILIPDTMKRVFQHYYGMPIHYENHSRFEEISINQFCGIEVFPHYKNEIVVYCIKYDLNTELDKPVIICLKDILNKK